MLFTLDLTPKGAVKKYFPKNSKKVSDNKSLVDRMRETLNIRATKVTPIPFWVGASIFSVLSFIGLSIGATIGTYVFFGIATLMGMIAISESNGFVKTLVMKSNKTFDLIIFGFTIYATAVLGVTVVASLTFAGLGYTLVYAPWLREQELINNQVI